MTPDFSSMTDAQRRDRANELREAARAQSKLALYYFGIMKNPDALRSRVSHLESTIARMQDELVKARDQLDNCRTYRVEAIEREEELMKEALQLENQSKIDRLMRLTMELNDAGVTQEELAAALAGMAAQDAA